jgi:DNA-binding MarR family transcriptional regulator
MARATDPADARARLVTLSDKVEALYRTAAAEVAKVEVEWRDLLGAKAYQQLRDALARLREISDPYR